jgi:hypothetical protein
MSQLGTEARPALRLVHGQQAEEFGWSWFCGHCAAPSPDGAPPAPTARVCRQCGLGLLIETREDAAPEPREAFLVVDSKMLVQAMSREAETLLKVREDLAVHRPLSELLVPADAEGDASGFAAAIAESASTVDEPSYAFVRPWNTFGVRVRARIATCGPPRAALIVLEGAQTPKLRLV